MNTYRRNSLEVLLLDDLQNLGHELLDGGLMDFVHEHHSLGIDKAVECIDRHLDTLSVLVVLGIEVGIKDFVSIGLHIIQARVTAAEERRPHISRGLSDPCPETVV